MRERKKATIMVIWKNIALIVVSAVVVTNNAWSFVEASSPPRTEQLAVLSICTQDLKEVQPKTSIMASLSDLGPLFASPLASRVRMGALCDKIDRNKRQEIKIRRRGYSSRRFAKKQYGIEFIDSTGETLTQPFLGLPAAKKWALHGPYIDRSYIRNALAYRVGRKIGQSSGQTWFAPEGSFAEVFLNKNYLGIYLITPKIQHGRSQIDIPALTLDAPGDVFFILEVSLKTPDFKTRYGTSLEYSYPGTRTLQKWQLQNPQATAKLKRQILAEVETFETILLSRSFAHPTEGYRKHVNIDSFVDFFIAQEVYKNIDAFRRSGFFYKGRDRKLHMGPLWDFDLALGNLSFWGMSFPYYWVHEDHGLPPKPLFWFTRLLQDPYFNQQVRARYAALRRPGMPLADVELRRDIRDLSALLGDAPRWDKWRWLGTYDYTQAYIFNTKVKGSTHRQHVLILETWLLQRLRWLDAHMPLLISKLTPQVREPATRGVPASRPMLAR